MRNLLSLAYSTYVWVGTYALMIGGSLVCALPLMLFGRRRAHPWTIRWALGGAIPLMGTRTTVTRHPSFDPERRGVFVQNHVSVLDGMVATWVLPHAFCGLFNRWHFWLPGYGWIMALSGGIGVPGGRSGRSQALEEAARDRARRGLSILAFPEGHRTRDGALGAFRMGVLRMARAAGYPVIPLSVRGMYEVNHKGSWRMRPGHLEVYLGPAYETEGLSDAELEALRDELHRVHRVWAHEGRDPYEEAR